MRIAVTGGIGVGKSEVMKIIKRLGYVTVLADEVNAQLLQTEGYVAKIAEAFPSVVKDGVVDKASLRDIIFSDENERLKLNGISHPIIRQKIEEVLGTDIFVELPLLNESGMRDIFDKVIVVTAPERMRIQRITQRANVTPQLAKRMIAAQLSDKERCKGADFIIENKGTLNELYTSITRVLAHLK